jgi:uracil-DNA glycosylase family 4
LFDRMLAAIGRDRNSVYLTALAVKRPPAGRVADEAGQKMEALIRHHLSLAAPKRVLALGNAASRAITGLDVANARGSLRVVNHDKGTSEVVASFHPRFLLERPAAKADAWKDLRLLIGGLE